jgi:hypothetical protein
LKFKKVKEYLICDDGGTAAVDHQGSRVLKVPWREVSSSQGYTAGNPVEETRRTLDHRLVDFADSDLRDRMLLAANDKISIETREAVCISLGTAFRSVSQALWVHGSIVGTDRKAGLSPFDFGSDAMVSSAWIAGFAGELVSGSVALLRDGNRYAAMALVRQLVEVEYLLWAVAEETEQAEAWIRSSKDERLRMWQPRHIRLRSQGRFRAEDYGQHCEQGGHPTPAGRFLLPGHTSPVEIGICWYELTFHAHSAWKYLVAAAATLDDDDSIVSVVQQAGEAVDLPAAVARWNTCEQLYELNTAVSLGLS